MKEARLENRKNQFFAGKMMILIILFFLCFFGSFLVGKYPISPIQIVKMLLSKIVTLDMTWSKEMETILFNIRLPRVIMACLIGAGISCAGAVYQGIFQNPMVSPEMLGASAGSGLGAALSLLFSLNAVAISINAFLGGMLAVAIVLMVDKRAGGRSYLTLVLAGIMVKALFTEGISFVKLFADPTNQLPEITYWLMGSLSSIRNKDVLMAGPLIILGLIPLFIWRWKINVMTMGDDAARSMGVNVKKLRLFIIIASTVITAACVSVSGMIGWVGLVIPHIARMVVGADFRKLLPASVLLGASFLMVTDNMARLLTTYEIPIGILTAFVGAPFFLYLIMKEGKR